MPIDSLEDVRLFRQVVASGSISAAARTLHDTKNRVSQRLAALERALGARLADRTTRRMRLTDEGERFYAASEALIDAAERTQACVTPGAVLTGRVRVAVRSAMSGFELGAELVRLLRAAPELRLQLIVVDDGADLHGQGLDLAVQVGSLRDSALVVKRIGEARYVMAATPSYLRAFGAPRAPADLVRHECIRRLSDEPEATWALVGRSGRRLSAPLGGRFECSDARLQTEVLYAGLGIGVRPAAEVRRAEQAGSLERVLPAWSLAPIPVWVVSPKGRLRLDRVARVVEALTRAVASLA
jgi:DNA-binding transcriptional LysR family regulator